MHEDYCGGIRHPGLCAAMDPYDGRELLKYLLRANFTGINGSRKTAEGVGGGGGSNMAFTSNVHNWGGGGVWRLQVTQGMRSRCKILMFKNFCSEFCCFMSPWRFGLL